MLVSTPTAILGAGMMGTAIAATHLRCGLPVVIYDLFDDVLCSAPQRIADELRLQNAVLHNTLLSCTNNIENVFKCPIVIETITEKIKAKKKLYQKLTENKKPNGFLFSNTSTISISALAEHLSPDWQRRFCGLHFFHPVRLRSLVEIVPGHLTDSATLEGAQRHASRIEKCSILVGDSPGFLVNRMLNAYLSSALRMLEEKVSIDQIERVAVQFGMKMGPFRIMDEIGLDVVLHAGWVLFKAFPERVTTSDILLKLIDQGKLGRKTGQGFMRYTQRTSWEGEGEPDPQFLTQNNILSDTEIEQRLFVSMAEEAQQCLEEGIIADISVADLASVGALGFPADKVGIAAWGRDNQV